MTQQPRRKVLKGLAITLPTAWATPVVESVILPAHAETSVETGVETGPRCEGDCDITSVEVNLQSTVQTVTLNGTFCDQPLVTVDDAPVLVLSSSTDTIVFDANGFIDSGSTYTVVVDCGCTCSDSYTVD